MIPVRDATVPRITDVPLIQRRQTFEEEYQARISRSRQKLFQLLQKESQQYEIELKQKEEHGKMKAENEKKFIEEAYARFEELRKINDKYEEERKIKEAGYKHLLAHFGNLNANLQPDIEDPEIGISAAQRFAGEDPRFKERMQKIMKEQKHSLLKQMKEKEKLKQTRSYEDRIIDEACILNDQLSCKQIEKANNTRSRMLEAVADYNKKLAMEKEMRKKLERYSPSDE